MFCRLSMQHRSKGHDPTSKGQGHEYAEGTRTHAGCLSLRSYAAVYALRTRRSGIGPTPKYELKGQTRVHHRAALTRVAEFQGRGEVCGGGDSIRDFCAAALAYFNNWWDFLSSHRRVD